MATRARYEGGYEQGVVVEYEDSDGKVKREHVPKGGLLPSDAPAKLRDELLAQEAGDWVKQNERKAD
jgi:hypothetical protein